MLIYLESADGRAVPDDFLASVAKLACTPAKFLPLSDETDASFQRYPEDGNPCGYSLASDWDACSSGFRTESISLPAFAAHCVRAICSIFPLDRYLAAHYENQMRTALAALTPTDREYLDKLAITGDEDSRGASPAAAAFLKFQRKLYLAYARED